MVSSKKTRGLCVTCSSTRSVRWQKFKDGSMICNPCRVKEYKERVREEKQRGVGEGFKVGHCIRTSIGKIKMVRGAKIGRNRSVQDVSPAASIDDSDCGVVEFTREGIEALLNEKVKRTNLKEKSEILLERVKKLSLCIKWFQELERNYILEKEKLQNMSELAEIKCNELETTAKNKEEESHAQFDLLTAKTNQMEVTCASQSDQIMMLQNQLAAAQQRVQMSDVPVIQTKTDYEVTWLRGELQQARDDRDRLNDQLQALTADVANVKESAGESHAQFELLIAKTNQMEVTCASQSDQIRMLQNQLAAAQQRVQMSDVSLIQTKTDYERLTLDLQTRLTEAEYKIMEGECVRKKLHNTIMELKGNIRVFCRVRPLLPDEAYGINTKFISYPTSTESLGRGIDLLQNGHQHSFTFDKVLSPETSQGDVFLEISQLIQSALDGYKVCIFAFGQTGSGKTYTMMGRPGNAEQKGLIPRSLEQIFETKEALQTEGWIYEMQVSMLEIYNETIRDLMAPNKSDSDGKQYAIRHDADGNTFVSDLTIVDVRSSKEVSFLLDQAAKSRSVGKTQMNEQSSRSHLVFTLRISGVNESTKQQVQGVLNLVDLAGTERLSRSGVTGDLLRETQAINKSLSSLSDVIVALAKKKDHIPFRNSKLTYLLKPCLGGDSKTLMVVNISPEPSSMGESLCSLRFASRVNACEIGVPRRQTNIRSSARLRCG